eukprot:2502725-Prymnesium_polylepis.1
MRRPTRRRLAITSLPDHRSPDRVRPRVRPRVQATDDLARHTGGALLGAWQHVLGGLAATLAHDAAGLAVGHALTARFAASGERGPRAPRGGGKGLRSVRPVASGEGRKRDVRGGQPVGSRTARTERGRVRG